MVCVTGTRVCPHRASLHIILCPWDNASCRYAIATSVPERPYRIHRTQQYTISQSCPNFHLYLEPVFAIIVFVSCDSWIFTCAAGNSVLVILERKVTGSMTRVRRIRAAGCATSITYHPLITVYRSEFRQECIKRVGLFCHEPGCLNGASKGLEGGQGCFVPRASCTYDRPNLDFN